MEERADSVGGTLEITSQEGDRGTKILLTVPIEMRGT
jgi:signal transduction histidine kinase